MQVSTSHVDLQALFAISYGLYVLTSRNKDGKLNGQITNAVFQVTDEPPRLAVSINRKELTHEYICDSGVFALNVLDTTAPLPFIGLFGFKTGREADKLAEVNYQLGSTGCPLVTDHTYAYIEAKVCDRVEVETHTVFIAEVVSARIDRVGEPMTYDYYQNNLKGKTPETAPTHRAHLEKKAPKPEEKRDKTMKKYECDVCGYIYDPAVGDPNNGIKPGTSFGDLPDDWKCPVCGVGKDQFSPKE